MAKRGRPRKPGKRNKHGRFDPVPTYDKGTERAQLMQELYGTDGCDAIGRAYRTGHLGQGSDAKAMLDMGRKMFNAYWATYANGKITCALGERSHGSIASLDEEKTLRRERWLNQSLSLVKDMGERHRKAFYQLVIDINPDCGPEWLDRGDAVQIGYAVEALKVLCGLGEKKVVELAFSG